MAQLVHGEHWTNEGYEIRQPDGIDHLTDIMGDREIDFFDHHHMIERSNQPFCLSVSLNAPHAQDKGDQ